MVENKKGIEKTNISIQIDIYYQTLNSDKVHHITCEPIDYFDPLEEGETYFEDGIPKYNHTWQYLPVPLNSLLWSVETRQNFQEKITFSTQYLDKGNSWLCHRSDSDGSEELIHSFDLGDQGYMIIRTFKLPGGRWTVHTAGLYKNNDDKLFSLPSETFQTAHHLSTLLAQYTPEQ